MLLTPWWSLFAGLGGVYLLITGSFALPNRTPIGKPVTVRIVGGLLLLVPLLAWLTNDWMGAAVFWIAVSVAAMAILKDKPQQDADG